MKHSITRTAAALALCLSPCLGDSPPLPASANTQISLQDLSSILLARAQSSRYICIPMEMIGPSPKPGGKDWVTHHCITADVLTRQFRLDSLNLGDTRRHPFYTVSIYDGKRTVRWSRSAALKDYDKVKSFIEAPSDSGHSELFKVVKPGVVHMVKVEDPGPFLRPFGFEFGPFTAPQLSQWALGHGGKLAVDAANTLRLSYDGGTSFQFDGKGSPVAYRIMADNGQLFEDLKVKKSIPFGSGTLPVEIQSRHTSPDGKEGDTMIKVMGVPRSLTAEQFTELLNPQFPAGLDVVPPAGNHYRLEVASRNLDRQENQVEGRLNEIAKEVLKTVK